MTPRSYWNVGAITKLPPREITDAMMRSGELATYGLSHLIESPKEHQFDKMPNDPHECRWITGYYAQVCTVCGSTRPIQNHLPETNFGNIQTPNEENQTTDAQGPEGSGQEPELPLRQ